MAQAPPPNPDQQKPEKHAWHNAIASFMSRHIRHIHAKSNEWYRVHRSGGRGGGGWNWLFKALILGTAGALAVQVFIWIVEVIRTILHWIADITPIVLIATVVGSLIIWLINRKHQI